jgi:hypothetical protein
MKQITVFLMTLFLAGSIKGFAQTQIYKEGTIITKANDTIKALVELCISYDKYVNFRYKDDPEIRKIKVSEITSMRTPYNVYKSIKVDKKESLFRESVHGKYLLYENIVMSYNGATLTTGNMTWQRSDPTYTYVFVAGTDEIVLHRKKDLEKISLYMANCPDAVKLVEKRSFTMVEMANVVTFLNNCN